MILAVIADQCQLGYIALQSIIEAMKELTDDESTNETSDNATTTLASYSNKKSLISALKKQKQTVVKKLSKNSKRGIYQVFDLISETHINSRLWLKARVLFVQVMFNQLNEAGKAKGNDENIIRDFGDIKYYCEKGLEEAEKYFDLEAKAYFKFINSSLDILRGADLHLCLDKLKDCLVDFVTSHQLSLDGVLNYLKASILKNDIGYAIDLLDASDNTTSLLNVLNKSIESFSIIQKYILENLKKNSGEIIEYYVNKETSYFDNIAGDCIKNIYNPLYHYLVHCKLRLGSALMLKSSYINNTLNHKDIPLNESSKSQYLWQHSLNVLSSGLEINKVICERSLCLEIELSYKYAHCIRELFMFYQLTTLNDVVEAYGYTINLIHHSNHDLNIIKNCYLELAIAFISTYDLSIIMDSRIPGALANNNPKSASSSSMANLPTTNAIFNPTNSTSSISSLSSTIQQQQRPPTRPKKITTQMLKAVEASLTALTYAIKTSNAMREKMLLPGHKEIKNMESINAVRCPNFVSSDLLAYYVLAERKRVYRDEIEEEVLSLAPEFDEKIPYRTYDDKLRLLTSESDKSITWIHLLNYQSKLQSLNSMTNLNTLKNGKNRYKYSQLYTIGITPIFKSTHIMASRLFELNSYLKTNLDIYRIECQAPLPINDFFKVYAKKSTIPSTKTSPSLKSLLKYVKFFDGNLSTNLKMEEKEPGAFENLDASMKSASTNKTAIKFDLTNLQLWPANWKQSAQSYLPVKINENTTSESFVDYVLTLNWFKELVVSHENSTCQEDTVTIIVAVRDPLTSNKLKFKNVPAEKVHEIHDK